MLISDELANELRKLIRAELQLAVAAIAEEGMTPLLDTIVELNAKQEGLLNTLTESAGAIVDSQARIEKSQARIEKAQAAFRDDDADEPWRASLEDVELDDSDD